MSPPLFDKVRRITADVLQVPPDQITRASSTEDIESWDSVHHLSLVLAFEQEFGLRFEPEDVDGMSSVERILAVLERKLSAHA